MSVALTESAILADLAAFFEATPEALRAFKSGRKRRK